MSDVVQTTITAFPGGKAQARAKIDRWLDEYAEGVSNHRSGAVGLAQQADLDAAIVEGRFAGADKLRIAALAAKAQPKEEGPKGGGASGEGR